MLRREAYANGSADENKPEYSYTDTWPPVRPKPWHSRSAPQDAPQLNEATLARVRAAHGAKKQTVDPQKTRPSQDDPDEADYQLNPDIVVVDSTAAQTTPARAEALHQELQTMLLEAEMEQHALLQKMREEQMAKLDAQIQGVEAVKRQVEAEREQVAAERELLKRQKQAVQQNQPVFVTAVPVSITTEPVPIAAKPEADARTTAKEAKAIATSAAGERGRNKKAEADAKVATPAANAARLQGAVEAAFQGALVKAHVAAEEDAKQKAEAEVRAKAAAEAAQARAKLAAEAAEAKAKAAAEERARQMAAVPARAKASAQVKAKREAERKLKAAMPSVFRKTSADRLKPAIEAAKQAGVAESSVEAAEAALVEAEVKQRVADSEKRFKGLWRIASDQDLASGQEKAVAWAEIQALREAESKLKAAVLRLSFRDADPEKLQPAMEAAKRPGMASATVTIAKAKLQMALDKLTRGTEKAAQTQAETDIAQQSNVASDAAGTEQGTEQGTEALELFGVVRASDLTAALMASKGVAPAEKAVEQPEQFESRESKTSFADLTAMFGPRGSWQGGLNPGKGASTSSNSVAESLQESRKKPPRRRRTLQKKYSNAGSPPDPPPAMASSAESPSAPPEKKPSIASRPPSAPPKKPSITRPLSPPPKQKLSRAAPAPAPPPKNTLSVADPPPGPSQDVSGEVPTAKQVAQFLIKRNSSRVKPPPGFPPTQSSTLFDASMSTPSVGDGQPQPSSVAIKTGAMAMGVGTETAGAAAAAGGAAVNTGKALGGAAIDAGKATAGAAAAAGKATVGASKAAGDLLANVGSTAMDAALNAARSLQENNGNAAGAAGNASAAVARTTPGPSVCGAPCAQTPPSPFLPKSDFADDDDYYYDYYETADIDSIRFPYRPRFNYDV